MMLNLEHQNLAIFGIIQYWEFSGILGIHADSQFMKGFFLIFIILNGNYLKVAFTFARSGKFC